MDEEYDVIVLGTGLKVSECAWLNRSRLLELQTKLPKANVDGVEVGSYGVDIHRITGHL